MNDIRTTTIESERLFAFFLMLQRNQHSSVGRTRLQLKQAKYAMVAFAELDKLCLLIFEQIP